MGLINKLFGHGKGLPFDDHYLVRFELAKEFAPENNAEVKNALDSISGEQKQNNKPAISETLPFASFESAEDFFIKLRDIAAKTAKPVTFAYFSIWEYDPNEKTKVGKIGSPDGNPHEKIRLEGEGHEFFISSEYQNMTVKIFEEIFNDPENNGSYEEKIDYCKEIRDAYLKSTHLSESEVAKLPTVEETESGNVKLAIPALANPSMVKDDTPVRADTPIYDPSSQSLYDPHSQSAAAATTVNNTPKEAPVTANSSASSLVESVNSEGVRTLGASSTVAAPASQAQSEAPKVDHSLTRRTIRKSIEDQAQDQVANAQTKGHVEAPQFSVAVFDPVEPGTEGYVDYQVNQKRKTFNVELRKIASQISDKNEKAIIKDRQEASKKVDQAVKKFHAEHQHDDDKIFSDIQAEMQEKANVEIDEANQKLDIDQQKQLDQAQEAYHAQVHEIEHQTKVKKQDSESSINQKYTERAESIFKDRLSKHDTELQKAEEKLVQKLSLQLELNARTLSSQLRSDGDKVLQEAFHKMNDDLDKFKVKALQENNSAKEVNISQQRVENEKHRLETPFDDLKQANQKLQEVQNQLGSVTAEKNKLQKINEDQEALLHANKHTIDGLHQQVNNLTTKQANDKVNKSNTEANELLNKLVSLQMAKMLGNDTPSSQASETTKQLANSSVSDQQMKLMLKGFRRLTTGLVVFSLLLIGAGGYTLYHQQQVHNQQMVEMTKTMNAKVAAAKKATPRSISQSEANKKALIALHENSRSKLDKYSNEKYYDLDKAIIDNDASAANTAVKAMGNDLKMNDHYRATQAQNLLQTAGNNYLATRVAEAN